MIVDGELIVNGSDSGFNVAVVWVMLVIGG